MNYSKITQLTHTHTQTHIYVCVCATLLSHVQLFATLWTLACQAPLSVGFSRQEYWSRLPYLPLGDLPNAGIEPRSPTLQADSLPAEPPEKPENTGEGSLSLLQQVFPAQELNRRLLHCRQILYQLSHQGSLMSQAASKSKNIWKQHRVIPKRLKQLCRKRYLTEMSDYKAF